MRNLFVVILLISLFSGCTKSKPASDEIPVAPIELKGTSASASQVNLIWSDKSTNETGFKVQRKSGTGSFADIVTLSADVISYTDNGLMASSTYSYRVYAYNAVGNSSYSNEITVTTATKTTLATVTTSPVSSITQTTANSGGNVTNDGGGAITARGVVWSTSPNPTVDLTTKTTDGTGTGSFTSSIDKLSTDTKYYVRSYATNSVGTAYGNEVIFNTAAPSASTDLTDIDGNVYPTIKICDEIWMAKNLNVSRYRNGDPIPQVQDQTEWSKLTTGAWCYYENKTANGTVYGKLYNWYAVTDPRGLAPEGWHVADDFSALAACLGGKESTGGFDNAGGKMKTTGTIEQGNGLWLSPNTGATNSSGFSALPGGIRYDFFIGNGNQAAFWINNQGTNSCVKGAWLYADNSKIFIDDFFLNCTMRETGLSVRCVKN